MPYGRRRQQSGRSYGGRRQRGRGGGYGWKNTRTMPRNLKAEIAGIKPDIEGAIERGQSHGTVRTRAGRIAWRLEDGNVYMDQA